MTILYEENLYAQTLHLPEEIKVTYTGVFDGEELLENISTEDSGDEEYEEYEESIVGNGEEVDLGRMIQEMFENVEEEERGAFDIEGTDVFGEVDIDDREFGEFTSVEPSKDVTEKESESEEVKEKEGGDKYVF